MGVEVGAEVGMGFRMGRSGGRLTWPDRAEQGRAGERFASEELVRALWVPRFNV